MTNRTYTDDDVQRLVDAARAVCDHLHRALLSSQLLPQYVELDNALAPFQPDPDDELAMAVKAICHGANYSGDERWHHIIQVVREHDRKAGTA